MSLCVNWKCMKPASPVAL
uniref:Uncharacterized protein n=1 Tax=Anguilla anguilla TaxID=7936 RepID=A0A0E9VQM5_ANGAN